MASENGNGTLAKLTEIRHRFVQDLDIYRKRRRDEYLGEVVDVVLADPRLVETPRAAMSQPSRENISVVPAPEPAPPIPIPTEVDPATAVTLAPPEKQPLKSYRVNVYGHCPACNAPMFEVQAKYCGRCAYPLDEA